MIRPFKGVWATFEFIDDAANAIEAVREAGNDFSVLSPCPRHELYHAMGQPPSRIPFVTLFFGGLGLFFGYGLPSWTSLDWVLPVGGKPTVGIPAYTIFGFELMVLLGGVSTAIAIYAMGFYDLFRKKLPGSKRFKSYNRFSLDRFGVVVRCSREEAAEVEKTIRAHNAEEVVSEF